MRKIAFLLTLVMLLSLFSGCKTKQLDTKAYGVAEDKKYCNATLDDDFSDDVILVTITNISSLKLKTYTVEDFSEIDCLYVNVLNKDQADKVRRILDGATVAENPDLSSVNINEFHQEIRIVLKEKGKQNVLDAIKELEKREDVLSASPNYLTHID
jgi:hypothetical protein